MLDPALIQRIRAIFLHREPRVTVALAAGMLGWSRREINAAVGNGEIEVVETCGGTSGSRWSVRRRHAPSHNPGRRRLRAW
jgi:hypothetical protein